MCKSKGNILARSICRTLNCRWGWLSRSKCCNVRSKRSSVSPSEEGDRSGNRCHSFQHWTVKDKRSGSTTKASECKTEAKFLPPLVKVTGAEQLRFMRTEANDLLGLHRSVSSKWRSIQWPRRAVNNCLSFASDRSHLSKISRARAWHSSVTLLSTAWPSKKKSTE